MKRNNGNLPLWRKTQGGNLKLATRKGRIKYKEEVEISEEELGKYKSQFTLIKNGTGDYKVSEPAEPAVEDKPAPPPETAAPADKDEYSVEHVSSGWYNVVSPNGTVMNEKKLKSKAAKKLKAKLEEETIEE